MSNDTYFVKRIAGDNLSCYVPELPSVSGTPGVTWIAIILCSPLHQSEFPEAREDACLCYFTSTPDAGL